MEFLYPFEQAPAVLLQILTSEEEGFLTPRVRQLETYDNEVLRQPFSYDYTQILFVLNVEKC